MAGKSPPRVYIFYGSHHPRRQALIQRLLERARRQGAREALDVQTLEGSQTTLAEVGQHVLTFPFFARRKIVWLKDPLPLAKTGQEAFLRLLAQVPVHTALILDIPEDLPENHWLLAWARQHPDLAYVRAAMVPRDMASMFRWMQEVLQEHGGKATPEALMTLYQYTGTDVQRAYQELQKLALYSQAQNRPATAEDVATLVLEAAPPNLFEFAHALAESRGPQAARLLRDLLQREDPYALWGLVIRHFRLLLALREVLDTGGDLYQWGREARLPQAVVRRMARQARNFTLEELVALYRRLFWLETEIRRFRLRPEEALERLLFWFAAPSASHT